MQNASVIAKCAEDDFFWEIYSRKDGLFEQDPPERDALLSAAKILSDDGKLEALSRLRNISDTLLYPNATRFTASTAMMSS